MGTEEVGGGGEGPPGVTGAVAAVGAPERVAAAEEASFMGAGSEQAATMSAAWSAVPRSTPITLERPPEPPVDERPDIHRRKR